MLSIGLMSGTSLDGIDAALLETDGKSQITDLGNEYLPYDPEFKILLKACELAVTNCNGNLKDANQNYIVTLENLLRNTHSTKENQITHKIEQLTSYLQCEQTKNSTLFERVIIFYTHLNANIIRKLTTKLQRKLKEIDVIGFHGQTLFHQPDKKITYQIGNGQILANELGIPVISDFRAKDMALGGQGAPFAPLYHFYLAMRDEKVPLAVLNCGGIANVTYIPDKSENHIVGFDVGPGNGLIDRYIQLRTSGKEYMDENGKYGKKGQVNGKILEKLKKTAVIQGGENFLDKNPPKSLDINDLHFTEEVIAALSNLSLEDACVTLEVFTAHTIVDSLKFVATKPRHWILAGGGWKNPIIYEELKSALKKNVGAHLEIKTADEIGWNSQAMEAQIFAHFAVRSLKNLPLTLPGITGVCAPTSGGNVYLPSNRGISNAVKQLLHENPRA